MEVARDEAGQPLLIDEARAARDDVTALVAVRRTGPGSRLARSMARVSARPLEPNEHRHHVHEHTCPARPVRAAEAAADVPDITAPRRTTP